MTTLDIAAFAQAFLKTHEDSTVQAGWALSPELGGLRLYDPPLIGVADAEDPLFEAFRAPGVVGPSHRLPADWLPGARSVLSFFFPITEAVRRSNAEDFRWPSPPWLHARYEGHRFLTAFLAALRDRLGEAGISAAAPMLHPDFAISPQHISNWSERHVAYACGLGTFGLSRGLITEKGTAGRFLSLVSARKYPHTPRPYTRYDEYCIRCGACIPHCPPVAIDPVRGKDNALCSAFLDSTRAKEQPRYGCGKCQVAVPCESGIPAKRNSL